MIVSLREIYIIIRRDTDILIKKNSSVKPRYEIREVLRS